MLSSRHSLLKKMGVSKLLKFKDYIAEAISKTDQKKNSAGYKHQTKVNAFIEKHGEHAAKKARDAADKALADYQQHNKDSKEAVAKGELKVNTPQHDEVRKRGNALAKKHLDADKFANDVEKGHRSAVNKH